MVGKIFTFCIGLVYVFFGAAAFVPAFRGPPSPIYSASNDHMHLGYCELFHQLPMNYLLTGIFLGFGLSAVLVAFTLRGARTWNQIMFFSALLLMAVGFSPHPFSDGFGFLPLYSWTCAIFLLTALATPYFAFFDGPVPDLAKQAVFRQVP